jgi:hypothetical protein
MDGKPHERVSQNLLLFMMEDNVSLEVDWRDLACSLTAYGEL